MSRTVRWVVMVVGTAATFAACLAAGWYDPLGVLPQDGADRLGIATAASGAVSAAIGAPLAWWAARDTPGGGTGRRVRQRAKATGGARLTQTAGPAADVDQRAVAKGRAQLHQSGAEQDPRTPGPGS